MESLAAWFQDAFLPYGHWGVLVLSALDASFVPMPQIIDLAVMAACAYEPSRAPAFVVAAVVGSTAGTMAVWGIARGGRSVARVGGGRLAWAESFLERRGTVALLVAALLPAPFPLKVVIIAAGYLKIPARAMLLGVGAGRLLRFGSQGVVAALWGEAIIDTVQRNAPATALVMAVMVAAAGLLYYRWSSTTRR